MLTAIACLRRTCEPKNCIVISSHLVTHSLSSLHRTTLPYDFVSEVLLAENVIQDDFHVMPNTPVNMHKDGARLFQEFPHQQKPWIHVSQVRQRPPNIFPTDFG